MTDSRADVNWSDEDGQPLQRVINVHDLLRYAQGADQVSPEIDSLPNFHWLMSPQRLNLPKIMLEAGVNAPAQVKGPDVTRRALIAIRSSPWKAGSESTPWHDEFDLDHGHVRYFGDHKPTTIGFPGATNGNKLLLEGARLHSGTSESDRVLAPPIFIFRATTVYRDGRAIPKGHVEFCGIALIERLEHIVQRDPLSGRSFPNLAVDLAVLALRGKGELDLRWIDDRRDPTLTAEEAQRHAPKSWRKWVERGAVAVPGARRRVLASSVKSSAEQQPASGTDNAATLQTLHRFYDDRKHAFELLASWVAAAVLRESGARYQEGWLSRPSGDGGVDFVGRIDVGSIYASTPLVVLGQAKCVLPTSTVSAEQVARVVARLKRGWIGVYVTTGSFSRQAQVEIIDDQYPVVLVSGKTLCETVTRIVQANHGGDLNAFLQTTVDRYADSVTYRRPEEVMSI